MVKKVMLSFIYPACAEDFCEDAKGFAGKCGFTLIRSREYVSFSVECDDPTAIQNQSRIEHAKHWYEKGWNNE